MTAGDELARLMNARFAGGGGGASGGAGGGGDRELLRMKVASLEGELHDYQYNMGLLLIEKKLWALKFEELTQALDEAQEAVKREQAAHLRVLPEAESKLQAAADKFAEASRKISEVDLMLQELQSRESALQMERLSFVAEKDAHESSLSRRKEDLWGLEKKLREGQQRLSASEELQNKRESQLNVSHRILTQREMDLEVSRRKITEADYLELKEKEAAIIARLADFEPKETVADGKCKKLEMKEPELLKDTETTERASGILAMVRAKKEELGLQKEMFLKEREDLKQERVKFEKVWEELEEEKRSFNIWKELEEKRLERDRSEKKKTQKDLEASDIGKSNCGESVLSDVQMLMEIDETKNLLPQQSFEGILNEINEDGLAHILSKVIDSKSSSRLSWLKNCSKKIFSLSPRVDSLLRSPIKGSDVFVQDTSREASGELEAEKERQGLSPAVGAVDDTIHCVTQTENDTTAGGEFHKILEQLPPAEIAEFKVDRSVNNGRVKKGGRLRTSQYFKQVMKKSESLLAKSREGSNEKMLTNLPDDRHKQTNDNGHLITMPAESDADESEVTTKRKKRRRTVVTRQYNLRSSTISVARTRRLRSSL